MSDQAEVGKRVVVVGGGAAGYFGAVAAAETNQSASVTLLEAADAAMSPITASIRNCLSPDTRADTGNYSDHSTAFNPATRSPGSKRGE
jgi:succinate dehydrogenase/fumarate reductase flavoprotein subunit